MNKLSILILSLLISASLHSAEIKDGKLFVDVEIVPNASSLELSSEGTITVAEEDSPFQLEFSQTSISIQIPDEIEITPIWLVGIKKCDTQKEAESFITKIPDCFYKEEKDISFDGKRLSVETIWAIYLSQEFTSFEEAQAAAEPDSWIEESYVHSYDDILIYDINNEKDYYLHAPLFIESSQAIQVQNVPKSNFWNPQYFITREYESDLMVLINPIGKLNLIAHSEFENYIAGVIPNEIGTDSPMEAMKAQAVAARSEALYKILNGAHKDDGFDLCASVHCQVFSGITDINAVTESAAENTRNIVGVYDKKVINAVYSTNCGGKTETSSNAWGGKQVHYLNSIYDGKGSTNYDLTQDYYAEKWITTPQPVYCDVSDEKGWIKNTYSWEVRYTPSNFQRMLSERASFGGYIDYKVLERGESGRILKMKLIGTYGELLLDNELMIRQTLGGLRSSLFYITRDSEYIRIIGKGSGHGVGMCQVGAITMAKDGLAYDKILKHYFKGIDLKTIEYTNK